MQRRSNAKVFARRCTRIPPLRPELSVKARCAVLAAVVSFFGIPLLSACSSPVHTITSSEAPTAGPATAGGQPGEPSRGKAVTMEVPHTSETVSGIREREAEEPHTPRGDAAMPPHRIRPADNAATTSPPGRKPSSAGE